jgi:hypothetical protein
MSTINLQNVDTRLFELLRERSDVLTCELEQTSELLNKLIIKDDYDTINETRARQRSLLMKTENKKCEVQKGVHIHKNRTLAKSYKIIALSAMLCSAILVGFFFVNIDAQSELKMKSRYVIENLKGDVVDTYRFWNIAEDRPLYVNIVNSDLLSPEKFETIKNTVLSTENVMLDDSLLQKGPHGSSSEYFVGWQGALQKASEDGSTKYHIPTEFKIIQSSEGMGDITITLTRVSDSDGYSGYTKSILNGNQILKSDITIYQADQLTDEQLSTIVRHELGHAFGLGHSSAQEDLMHDVIKTGYPYISDCDIEAVRSLYNGNNLSEVVCEK